MFSSNCLPLKTHEDSLAQQDVNFIEMEEELTCPVCLELFADPLMLPCSHSICKTCLHDIMKCRTKQGKDGLECPACREGHRLTSDQVNKLPKNLALENIVFRYQEIRSHNMSKGGKLSYMMSVGTCSAEDLDTTQKDTSEDFLCGMCDEDDKKSADWFCSQCTVLYCQHCLSVFHPKRGPLLKHKLMKPMVKLTLENSMNCPDHEIETASIFCGTCKVVACHLCVCQGIGQHCSHLILDLETAKKQLQADILKAKGDLDNIISSISKKDNSVNTKLQFLKSLEMCAVSDISTQCNCILADVAVTLELARKKSVRNILDISSKHSSHLKSSSQQIKSLLSQCQNLEAVCKDLLGTQSSQVCQSPVEAHLQRHFSSPAEVCLSDTSCTSAENVEDPFSDVQDKLIDSREKSLDDKDDVRYCETEMKKRLEAKKRASSDSINYKLSSQKSSQDKSPKQYSLHSRPGGETPIKDKPLGSTDEQRDDLARTRKSVVDQKNSERKMSAGQVGVKNLLVGEEEMLNEKLSLDLSVDKDVDNSENMLLQRAVEVGPIIQQISTLSLESEGHQTPDFQDTQLNEDETKITNCVLNFHATTLALLSNISEDSEMNCPIITPSVRSVVSPAAIGGGAPRVQNRLLITWGFSSTTFTADPVEHSAQWSVHIARNTSHFGDIKSGYLFGVGVSTKPLNSKDQVGMTPESDGIVCVNGQLALCQDSQLSTISPLRDLPVILNIYIDKNSLGYIMAYKIMFSDSSSSIRGKRLIKLFDQPMEGCEEQSIPQIKVYPVFTLSQRVKMQFPLSSDV